MSKKNQEKQGAEEQKPEGQKPKEQDPKAEHSVGDFVRYKPGSTDYTYRILQSVCKKTGAWVYILEHENGRRIESKSTGEMVASADPQQRQKWIDSRKARLVNDEEIGRLLENYLLRWKKWPEHFTQGKIESDLTTDISLSDDEKQRFEAALSQAIQEKMRPGEEEGTFYLISADEKQRPEQQNQAEPVPKASEEHQVVTMPAGLDTGGPPEQAGEKAAAPAEVLASTETLPTEAQAKTDGQDVSTEIPAAPPQEETTPKQLAERLVAQWENLDTDSDRVRQELAEQMLKCFDALQQQSEASETVNEFFSFCGVVHAVPHPLFWMLSGSRTPIQRRQLLGLLNLNTLERYVKWLDNQSGVPISQMEGLLDALSDHLARAFQAATREGGADHYQRISHVMSSLLILLKKLKKMDNEAPEPYEWRLFSFLREGWARIAPQAQVGSNDLTGARGYLTWILEAREMWSQPIWDALLTSLLRDAHLDHLEGSIRRQILKYAADYVLSAPEGQRRTRLLHCQEYLSEKLLFEFAAEIGRKASESI